MRPQNESETALPCLDYHYFACLRVSLHEPFSSTDTFELHHAVKTDDKASSASMENFGTRNAAFEKLIAKERVLHQKYVESFGDRTLYQRPLYHRTLYHGHFINRPLNHAATLSRGHFITRTLYPVDT